MMDECMVKIYNAVSHLAKISVALPNSKSGNRFDKKKCPQHIFWIMINVFILFRSVPVHVLRGRGFEEMFE